jgi:hypothetical protein
MGKLKLLKVDVSRNELCNFDRNNEISENSAACVFIFIYLFLFSDFSILRNGKPWLGYEQFCAHSFMNGGYSIYTPFR